MTAILRKQIARERRSTMHRIGVFATRPADQQLVRDQLESLFDNLPRDAAWSFHYFRSWGRFRLALGRGELQLGLVVHTLGVDSLPPLLETSAEHAIAVISTESLPAELAAVSRLATADVSAATLQSMLRQTLHRAELDREVRFLADHDACTGLLRTAAFVARLDTLAKRPEAAERMRRHGALLCLRLDGFSELEATLGGASADRVLRMAAERMRGVLHHGELLARGDGAEFLAWMRAGPRPELTAQRLQATFNAAFQLNESSAFVCASAGIARPARRPRQTVGSATEQVGSATEPQDVRPPAPLQFGEFVRQARAAADMVLQQSGTRVLSYDADVGHAARRQQLRSALATAIERDEFDVFYQPIIDIRQGNVAGAEALLRWHGHAVGTVSPAHFIPLAEESGAILSIGQWVLRRAAHDAVLWLDRYWTQVRLAVNISAEQFRSGRLHEDLHQLLQELPLHPTQIELEISERSFLQLAREQYALFETLRDQGFRIVLDEFGSSYASISYLKDHPVDVLKIDRQLIGTLGQNGGDDGLITAMVALGRSMGMRVVGVGVETERQLDILRAAGCDEAQGFYLGAPMPGDEFIAMLLRNPAVTPPIYSASLQG